MSMWTEAEAQAFYDNFKAAYLALSAAGGAKEYELNDGTRVKREDLSTIKSEMVFWKDTLQNIQNGESDRITSRQVIT